MGDVSIIARRLADGHVQYGWSGNGGYFSMVGIRLLLWYQESENVEYLFSLGQTSLIGKIGSEKGGFNKKPPCLFFTAEIIIKQKIYNSAVTLYTVLNAVYFKICVSKII